VVKQGKKCCWGGVKERKSSKGAGGEKEVGCYLKAYSSGGGGLRGGGERFSISCMGKNHQSVHGKKNLQDSGEGRRSRGGRTFAKGGSAEQRLEKKKLPWKREGKRGEFRGECRSNCPREGGSRR